MTTTNYVLPTTLTHDNVISELKSIQATKHKSVLIIDCALVAFIDSVGIAMLLELSQTKDVHLININEKILALANLYQISL